MNPFYHADYPEECYTPGFLMKKFQMTMEEAQNFIEKQKGSQVVQNDRYEVVMRKFDNEFFGPVCHLSIKRRDKLPIHDWRDLQQIKNLLTEAECEAIEIYPAESRLVDTANQYHLWVLLDKRMRIPFGFGQRLVQGADEATVVGARQRPFGLT